MKKNLRSSIIYLSILITFLCSSCLAPEPKTVSFNGQWKQIFENCISGAKEELVSDVKTDGNRFRIENESSIVVYDGTYIHMKYKANEWSGDSPTQTEEMAQNKAMMYKFWLNSSGGDAGAGGNIAGQETTLYTSKLKKPEGEFASQNWIDAKTGINLKSSRTVYSKQIGQLVTRETSECMQIEYTPVDDSAFTKPE